LSRPFTPRSSSSSASFYRVNGKIRAREVRVIGDGGKQLGVMALGDALNLARANGVDLVEIAATAQPPVCRMVDYGKFRYEQAKKDKDSKKHQHANKVKEVQLSPKIDAHDLQTKIEHCVNFLCEDMKVKITLKFRGREMAHTEFGFQVVQKFLGEIAAFGHPDFEPKLIGRGINVMISPLPRNKRPKNPHQLESGQAPPPARPAPVVQAPETNHRPEPVRIERPARPHAVEAGNNNGSGFVNNPFEQLEINR
jgi:translation initiation factor IF-3